MQKSRKTTGAQRRKGNEMEYKCSIALHPFWCCTKHKMDVTIPILGLFCPKNIYDMAPLQFAKQSLKNKRSGGLCAKATTSLIWKCSKGKTKLTMRFTDLCYPKNIYDI